MKIFRANIFIEKVTSTMDVARKLATFIEPPFIIVTDYQSKGKGQYKRSWSSEVGGLWFTEVIEIKNAGGLSTFISIPILRVLKRYAQKVALKWPNDIYLEGKKLGGILTEINNGTAFIGVGININNPLPAELKETGIALSEKTNINKNKILEEIVREEDILLPIFLTDGFKDFREEYKSNLIFINKEVTVKSYKTIIGTVVDVSENGELIVKTPEGNLEIIAQGTIESF